MWARGWPTAFALLCFSGPAVLFPYTSVPSQISPPPPSMTSIPSSVFPSPSILPTNSLSTSSPGESAQGVGCNLTISPPVLVVRFGDPVKANCSMLGANFPLLGWVVSVGAPEPTFNPFLVWSVDRMTEWSITPVCYAASDVVGQCHAALTLTVYQPPKKVSIQFAGHSGPLLERHHYTLLCTVEDVAPVERLIVSFYQGETRLRQIQLNGSHQKTLVNSNYTHDITACKEDNGTTFWCEAQLELGPAGPQLPPMVTSQNMTALVLSDPRLTNSTEPQQEESLKCKLIRENSPQDKGTTDSIKWSFVLAALLTQMVLSL